MILTAENLLDYLLERQLITLGAVVDGDYRVEIRESRHTTFQIRRRDAPGLFLKQPHRWDAETLATVHREALCYRLATESVAFAPLAPLLPACLGFDPEHCVLALELVGRGENLGIFHQRQSQAGERFPPWIGHELGRRLGQYHRHFRLPPGASTAMPERNVPLPDQPPWILQAHRMATGRRTAPQVLELIARDPQVTAALEDHHRTWQVETLIHGDLKLQNCVLKTGPGGEPAGLKIVDWELAALGEASWDVGSVLQSYLVLWVLSMPWESSEGELTGEERMRRAEVPLDGMRPLFQAFWRGYGEHASSGPEWLRKSLMATGARLLQTAFEYGAANRELHPNVVLLVQLASNILSQPLHAAEVLLGLEP